MHGWLNQVSVGKQLLIGAEAEFSLFPFKLLLAYFAMYAFLPSVLNEKKLLLPALLKLLSIMAISMMLYRLVYCYYTRPIVYGISEGHLALFSIMGCWMTLLDIVPIAAIAVVIKFIRVQNRSREKERSLMKAKLETELKFLRNQTNPYFLFNTLTSIHALACINSDDTPKVIMTLSKLLNFTLYESMKAMIVVDDEMQMIDKYIELESIRYEGKREIDFISEIDNAYEQIAPLMLLSLIQHAFMRVDGIGGVEPYIQIDIKLQSGVLNLRIETNWDRSDQSMPEDSVGLANMRRRIGLLYSDYDLEIEDGKELFKAGLAINLHSYAEI
jgi:two-component system, LytTR family, sensor kinase